MQPENTTDLSVPFNIAIVTNLSGLEDRLKGQGFDNFMYVEDAQLSYNGKISTIWRAGKERGMAISRAIEEASIGGRMVTLIVRTEAGWVNTLIESVASPNGGQAMTAAIWTSIENSLVGFGTLRRRRAVYLESPTRHHLFPAGYRLPQSWVANHPTRAERSPNNRHTAKRPERQPSFHETLFLAIKGHFNNKLKGTNILFLPTYDKPISETVLGRFICASTGNASLNMADYNRVLYSALVSMTMRPYWNNMEAIRELVVAGSTSPHDVTMWLVNRIMMAETTVLTVQPVTDEKSKKLWEDCHASLDLEAFERKQAGLSVD